MANIQDDRAQGHARSPEEPVGPLFVGARNCVQAVGMSWVWVRRFAAANDVPVLRVGDRKVVVPAAQLMAAMRRVAAVQAPAHEPTEAERLAALRARLGLELRPGAAAGNGGG